jgi:hypothetical protein
VNHSLSQNLFTETDIRQIEAEGLSVEKVIEQITLLMAGTVPVNLNRPCTIGDGIVSVEKKDIPEMIALCEEGMREGRVVKFVPASGAASRMFKDWYKLLEKGGGDSEKEERIFAENLRKYPFLSDLRLVIDKHGESLEALMKAGKYGDVLSCILTTKGLNYGSLPKALLKFHAYPHETRTALEEHLIEGILYAQDANRVCRIHFTVSEEHQESVSAFISGIKKKYESRQGVTLDVTLSTQQSSTNTISVDMDNRPFRDAAGRLSFRPGGHGALLKNMNEIDGDIIFLKNIDNVTPDRLKPAIVYYKKALGGCLVRIQKEVFHYLHLLESKRIDDDVMKKIVAFCSAKLHIVLPAWFQKLPLPEKCAYLFEKLNRPVRVCGMVKNEGEPGGGPFWIENRNGTGTLSLQIIEDSQVDAGSDEQKAVWAGATHFNPVDLVCGVRDYRYRKFDLQDFVDENTFFISKKTEKGKELKALELPGLWNGSMAFWNTIFVEVPVDTFNPVKTVDDLLRPQHLTGE